MFILTVKGNDVPDRIYFVELMTQCALAKHAYSRLAEYTRVQLDRDYDVKKARPLTPIEVIADCTVFLSAAAVIAKLLFPRESSAGARALDLRTKLGVNSLPHLNSTAVRNSFEHIDERLDRIVRDHKGQEVCQIHVARQQPQQSVVLKRFDPNCLSLSFLGDTLDLRACHSELLELERLLKHALKPSRVEDSGEGHG